MATSNIKLLGGGVITYDNTNTGINSTNVQGAVTEVNDFLKLCIKTTISSAAASINKKGIYVKFVNGMAQYASANGFLITRYSVFGISFHDNSYCEVTKLHSISGVTETLTITYDSTNTRFSIISNQGWNNFTLILAPSTLSYNANIIKNMITLELIPV